MSGKPILVFATVALLIAGVTVAMTVGGTHHPGTPAPAASQPATTGRTTIDAIAGETFTSAPGAKSRRTLLKPMAALRHFYGKAAHMSAGVNVQLGYLTLPPAPATGSCTPSPHTPAGPTQRAGSHRQPRPPHPIRRTARNGRSWTPSPER